MIAGSVFFKTTTVDGTYKVEQIATASDSLEVSLDSGSFNDSTIFSDNVDISVGGYTDLSVRGQYERVDTSTDNVSSQANEVSYRETVTASSSVTIDAGYGANLYGSSDVVSVTSGNYAYVGIDGGYTDTHTESSTPVAYSGNYYFYDYFLGTYTAYPYSGVANITTASTDNSSTTAASLLEVTAGSYASVYGSADEVVVTSGGDADVDVSGNSTYSYEYAANAKQGSGTDYFGNSYTYAYGETTLSTSDVFVSASTSVEVTGGSNYYDQVNVNGSAVEITASGYNVNIGNYSGASTGGGYRACGKTCSPPPSYATATWFPSPHPCATTCPPRAKCWQNRAPAGRSAARPCCRNNI